MKYGTKDSKWRADFAAVRQACGVEVDEAPDTCPATSTRCLVDIHSLNRPCRDKSRAIPPDRCR